VVIGGDPLHSGVAAHLDPRAVVIAADSGYDHAIAAGLRPRLLLGDLDSISPEGLAAARADGVDIAAFPADKDATDTELALDHALEHVGRGGSITMVGGGGDRLDHLLSSLTVLAQPRFDACAELSMWMGPAFIRVLHAPRTISIGALPEAVTLSLVPIGSVEGVTTSGLRWPLVGEPLPLGTSRGVSNLSLGGPVAITATAGVLAVILPQAADLPPAATPAKEST
jgi:thiamine pyrophosphokinase